MAILPFALTGGVWFLYAMGYNLSLATGVGFIALALVIRRRKASDRAFAGLAGANPHHLLD